MNPKPLSPPLALIGGSADASDVLHATGFAAPDPFLCILDRGWSHLIVTPLELGRARAVSGNVTCHTPDDLCVTPPHRGLGGQLAAYLQKKGHRQVRVSPRCPVGIVRHLESTGLQVLVHPDPQRPGRLIKSDAEVSQLKAAQKAAVAGVKTAKALIGTSTIRPDGLLQAEKRTPLTSERVRAAITRTLLEYGCHAEEIIVAGGDQAVDPHERGHGPLRAGEWIILDVFPRSSSGYWGDITRTVMKGPPSPEQKKLYRTVLRAQTSALKQVKAGVRGDSIHQGIVNAFEQAGYSTGLRDGVPQGFIHSTGHGVGLDIHEEPRISPGGRRLRKGMVVTIEPGLYYRGVGGVRIEDTVVVTADGCQPLAQCDKQGTV